MKTWFAALFFCATATFAQQPQSAKLPPADRSKLPISLQNLPLERLSSGGLMLLNRDDNLVAPPRNTTAKGSTTSEEQATAAVTLDPRIGANIRLGNDPPQLPANMRAQAEPFIARSIGSPDFLVATFQEGRFATDGGAVDCGYSVTHDGGLTWTRALIPSLTMASGGPYFRATDPVVALGLNNYVYLNTLGATDANFANGAVLVSKSTDSGATFAAPRVVYRPANNSVFPDKEWIAINTFPNTASASRIIVTFTLFSNANANGAPIMRSYSTDGGLTWSAIAAINGANTSSQGSQPLFLPNGNCAVVYWNFGSSSSPGERLEIVSSPDGGVTFGALHRIAAATEWNEPAIRTGSFLPSATGDRTTNNIYVVYQAMFGGSPRIVFTKSTDAGVTWTAPIAISNNPTGLGVFNPAISASPDGHTLSVAFYDHRDNPSSNTLVDLYLAQSFDGGATWQPNIRLTSVSTNAALAPLTSSGYMLGDYLGIAQSPLATVPSVPVWVDTRTGNPDPFVTRAGTVPYSDLATGWEAARASFAKIPSSSIRPSTNDVDRDGEDAQSEAAAGTNAANPLSVTRTGRELDIATRLHVETGAGVGIAGFIIGGSAPKKIIVRALGPSLTAFGVPGALQDPTLELYNSSHTLIASNNNWMDSQASEIQASGYAPGDAREAAILRTLAPGAYTAIVRGLNDTIGAALLEVHDLDAATSTSSITNLSTRGQAETGSNVMIAGVILGDGRGQNGDGSSEVLVRVIGPELTGSGLSGTLQDPTLELHDANGNLIFSNDNWNDTQQAAIQATGLAPGDAREPAILTTLVQGNWTAIVRGKNNTTGLALVEVYRVH